MSCSLVLVVLALRAGLVMRRRRHQGRPAGKELIARHLRLAKPAVGMICLGLVAGPVSAYWLRDWTPLGTLHAWLGLVSGTLFGVTALLGLRLAAGESRHIDAHGWLGLLATLLAALTSFAGFVLLP
jgi:hypothetical protein